jgi:hypothetical protein
LSWKTADLLELIIPFSLLEAFDIFLLTKVLVEIAVSKGLFLHLDLSISTGWICEPPGSKGEVRRLKRLALSSLLCTL